MQNDIEKEEATDLTTSDKFIWPTQGYSVSMFYQDSTHNGIDIRGSIGDDIYACADGVVTKAEYTTVRNLLFSMITELTQCIPIAASCWLRKEIPSNRGKQ